MTRSVGSRPAANVEPKEDLEEVKQFFVLNSVWHEFAQAS